MVPSKPLAEIAFSGLFSQSYRKNEPVLINHQAQLLWFLALTSSSSYKPFELPYIRYNETRNCEKSINSLTTVAGVCIPSNGTMSTCNQFSTAEPTTAPATSPPIVITLAFPVRK
ncbi:hypothetical protein H5410_009970 [Solanum commersonii]|uniref:Uncharacterized protein n=1 Tax=Solanum commersonii TaxID=4109 RepID=A0A9J6AJE0_SOLCO|nr:hypothetical protein H5410_009970 [Solanum commersonii]